MIIGAGVVGRALGKALREQGLPVAAVVSRSHSRARSAVRFIGEGTPTTDPAAAGEGNLIMLATIDRVLQETALKVATAAVLPRGSVAFHCSGAFAGEAIRDLRGCGAAVGSFHPLQAFASPEEALILLPGSSFAIEGDPRALPVLSALAKSVGGRPVKIQAGDKALYHAAAAVTSNSMVAIAHLGTTMLSGVPSFARDPFPPLRALLRGTLRNLERLGPDKALTRPIVRGDLETVHEHLSALRRADKRLLPAYRLAAMVTLEAAVASGRLTPAAARKMRSLLVDERQDARDTEAAPGRSRTPGRGPDPGEARAKAKP